MTDKPRHWFNFSLRTLFVVVTLVCCWLAWESSIVRNRQVELKRLKSTSGFTITTAKDWVDRVPPQMSQGRTATVSWIRRLLGDEAIQEIEHHFGSEPDLNRISHMFPEAAVRHAPLMEPCHPGCFPRGTLVDTPQGPRPIETIVADDLVIAFLPSGELVEAPVQSVFVTTNRLWQIETDEATLITTETQPLCLAIDSTRGAGELAAGDNVLRCLGGDIHSAKVLQVTRTDRTETVINLVLADSARFIANGFLARSKPPAAVATR